MSEDFDLLFHRLNNQLGIILANAELLEAKLGEETARVRASQVVASALEAMTTARELRLRFKDKTGQSSDTATSPSSKRCQLKPPGPGGSAPDCTPFLTPKLRLINDLTGHTSPNCAFVSSSLQVWYCRCPAQASPRLAVADFLEVI
jgi:hypothetical protein